MTTNIARVIPTGPVLVKMLSSLDAVFPGNRFKIFRNADGVFSCTISTKCGKGTCSNSPDLEEAIDRAILRLLSEGKRDANV